MASVTILDYKMGNLTSVANAFASVGAEVRIAASPAELRDADRIVLPGVGAFGEGMKHLTELGFTAPLREEVMNKKKPFLGICLGMQVLAERGFEFGDHAGLGWIPGQVKKLEAGTLRIPHVGWNNLKLVNPNPLFDGIPQEIDFYFVHSFHFETAEQGNVSAVCGYGQDFTAAVAQGNIFGVQFHPEKSQKAGVRLLQNFLSLGTAS